MAERNERQRLIDHKVHQDLLTFAETLEAIARKLKEEGQFTFTHGGNSTEIVPSKQLEVEYEYTVKGDKHEFEIEFEWYTNPQGEPISEDNPVIGN